MTKFSWQFDPLSDEPNKIEITADGVPFAKMSTLDNAKRICKTLADGLQLAARDKRIAELEAAIESYRTGVDWGKVYAWLQHGAPTEGEGIAMAKRIIHLHVNADALAGGES